MSHPIDAAISGLYTVWHAAPALRYVANGQPNVPLKVVDGPPLTELDEPRGLFVGTGSQYVSGGAQAQRSYDYAGATESVDVVNELHCWTGDTDSAVARATAFEVLDDLSRLLAADRTLGGTVDWARLVRTGYQPLQDDTGCGVVIEFTVRVDAHRDHQE